MFWLVGNEIGLLWNLDHKKQRFSFFVAKLRCTELYSTKHIFWFVCHKIVFFSVLLSGKRFFPVCSESLSFTWFYSKLRFRVFSAKIRCFQHYVSDNRLLLVFVRKLCFWPFIDNMFWCVGNEIGSFERYVTKKQRFGFRCKIPFFQSPSTKNKFWFVGNEIKLLWGLNHKKERFCFFVAKTRCFQLYCSNMP